MTGYKRAEFKRGAAPLRKKTFPLPGRERVRVRVREKNQNEKLELKDEIATSFRGRTRNDTIEKRGV
jgi:hypothetical protein